MPPITSRDFQKAAAQRLIAAEVLLHADLALEAQYFGGYVVECSLKALIMDSAPEAEKASTLKKITSGAASHRPDVLLDRLRAHGITLPDDLRKRMRRFTDTWETGLRYEVGRRDMGETCAFLSTAKAVLNWVEENLS